MARTRPLGSGPTCPAISGRRLFLHFAVLFAGLVSASASPAEMCPPALILVVPGYQAPRGFEYARAEDLPVSGGNGEHALGVIATSVGWEVDIAIRQRCLGDECRLCVERIEGTAGFEPGRIRVAEHLRGDRCRTEAVLAHEERHSQVFDESTRLGVRRLVVSLTRWAEAQVALHATPGTVDAAASVKYREIEALMEEGTDWIESRARVRNERIDGEGAYRAELEDMERRCR